MKKDIYRKAALERLATVDQLDKVMKITSPLSWLALLGVTGIIVATLIWSFIGSLPSTITARGIIVSSSTPTNTLCANGDGTVILNVTEGQEIRKGDVIARILPNDINQETIECVSDQWGWVSNILKINDKDINGEAVTAGTELIRVRPHPRGNQKQVVVCYVPFSDIGKIDFNMIATITLTSASSSEYGHMEGQVINIDRIATTNKGIEAVVGSDNNMAQKFVNDGAVCAVTLEPTEAGDNISANGYWWSNEKGYTLSFNDRMECTVKIKTSKPEDEKPIYKLFTKLKDIWEGRK